MHENSIVRRRSLPLFVTVLLVGSMTVTPARGGKPVPPPPLPPVHYNLTWLGSLGRTSVEVWDINNSGHVVGEVRNLSADGTTYIDRTAFVSAGGSSGVVIDLNFAVGTIIGQANRTDWKLTAAFGINETNHIVGQATNVLGQSRGFVTNDLWTQCMLLPTPLPPLPTGVQLAKKINNWGDVVA